MSASAHRSGNEPSPSSSSPSVVAGGASLARPLHRSVSRCDSSGGGAASSLLPDSGNIRGNRRLISAAASDDFDGTGNPEETFQTSRSTGTGTTGSNNGEIPPHNVPADEDDEGESTPSGPIASLALSDAPRPTDAATATAANESSVMDVSTDAVSQDEREDDDEDDHKHEVEDEDESDYDYDYEDDDDQHFTGFLLPADVQNEHSSAAAVAASSSASAGGANLIDPDAPPSVDGDAPSRGSEAGGHTTSGSNVAVASSSSSAEAATEQQRGGSKWREPSRDAVSMSLRAESEKTGGRRRLASDLYKIMMGDTTEQGFSMEPSEEDSMERWTIKLFGFDEDSNLSRDLAALGLDHVELEMSFPDDYPFEPPFVRVVRPRFKRQTGFVMNGALCMELLTTDGWNPVNDIESVIVSIRSLLVVGDGRLAAAADLVPDTKARGASSKKKGAVAKVGKAKKGAAGDGDDVAMMQEHQDDEGDVGGVKRQRVSDGKPAVAAAAAAADSEDDVDRMDEDEEDDVDAGRDSSPRSRGGRSKKRPSAKISAAEIGSYSAAEARAAYSHLSDYHKKKGWDSSGWWARKG